MISKEKEERILTLLNIRGVSLKKIAMTVEVSRGTVAAVRDNRMSRNALRKIPVYRKLPTQAQGPAWTHDMKLDILLGREGRRFVCVVKDIINIDSMRAIHHPLFASLVKQARDTLKLLPKEKT